MEEATNNIYAMNPFYYGVVFRNVRVYESKVDNIHTRGR